MRPGMLYSCLAYHTLEGFGIYCHERILPLADHCSSRDFHLGLPLELLPIHVVRCHKQVIADMIEG